MKLACLILDPAHGKDTPGKQSPDGTFHEWKWSRDMCRRLMYQFFVTMKMDYDVVCPFLIDVNEPGLTNRVNTYNGIAESYKFTFMLSLHVNASAEGKWWKSKMTRDGSGGVEIWTDKDHNYSDKLAEVFMLKMMDLDKKEFYRHNTPTDISKDNDFTVIHGYRRASGIFVKRDYEAVLLETLFMDNLTDYGKLIDPAWNNEWMKVIGLSAHEVMKYNGFAN